MARVLVIHHDKGPRRFIEGRVGVHHQVRCAEDLAKGMTMISSFRPEIIVAGLDTKKLDAIDLLRYLKRSRIEVPVVVTGPAGTGLLEPLAKKHGAAVFVEYPMEQATLDRALSQAVQTDKDAHGTVPPITDEELSANLSELEKQFNRQMQCFAGKNQVYIQSMILGNGRTSKPRIALKCPLRKQINQEPNVYHDYIRDVCCGDPSGCEAYQAFKAKNPG